MGLFTSNSLAGNLSGRRYWLTSRLSCLHKGVVYPEYVLVVGSKAMSYAELGTVSVSIVRSEC